MSLNRKGSTVVEVDAPAGHIDRLAYPTNTLGWGEPFDPLERRISPRSVALEFRSWIGWMTDEGFVVVAARLMDISQGGVAVESVDAPPLNHEVWFCLHPSDSAFAVSGEVVRLGRGERDQHLIRVAFWAPCPASMLRWAVDGVRPPAEINDSNLRTVANTASPVDDEVSRLLDTDGPTRTPFE